jgi:hypothetical protein
MSRAAKTYKSYQYTKHKLQTRLSDVKIAEKINKEW